LALRKHQKTMDVLTEPPIVKHILLKWTAVRHIKIRTKDYIVKWKQEVLIEERRGKQFIQQGYII
jgi:hypothetical protein